MAFTSDSVQVFLAALDHGSFSAAARALSRVPSAVSMTIAHLEAELAVQLFDRSGREPWPTAAHGAGAQARLLAGQLQQLNAQALALTQGLEERRPWQLRQSCWPRLDGANAALAQHPLLQVEVLTALQVDALALLHSGRAQLALVFERPSIDGREGFQEVGTETLVAVMAPQHPVLVAARAAAMARGAPPEAAMLREEHLTTTRQDRGGQPRPGADRPALCVCPPPLAHRQPPGRAGPDQKQAWAGAGSRAPWCSPHGGRHAGGDAV